MRNVKVLNKYYQLYLSMLVWLLIKQQVIWDSQQATECSIDGLSRETAAAVKLRCHHVADYQVKWKGVIVPGKSII